MQKKLLVLGCTGSIGCQTLDIVRRHPDRFAVCGLAAGKNQSAVQELCKEFSCAGTVFSRDGMEGIAHLVGTCGADMAVNGISGSAGLEPSLCVLENGMDLALANKETVVMAWPLVQKTAARTGASIVPVDSEHSAIFNMIHDIGAGNISGVVITASGGPFREYTTEQLKHVTMADALKHPTWRMGPKITVDSASLANKGLEVIEAVRLFSLQAEQVQVVVHPQSLVHSLVRTKDGMLYAQISDPDMRHPIFGALVWPDHERNALPPFDLAGHTMTFFPPRFDDFPLLSLAYDCAKKDGAYPLAFNAANEVAVQAFMDGSLSFIQIAECVKEVLRSDWSMQLDSLDAIRSADRKARICADTFVRTAGRTKP